MTIDRRPSETEARRSTESLTLAVGAHPSAINGMCAMEAVSHIAGEPWSDHPSCACPVISAFLRAWNDGLADDERDVFLLPLIARVVDTFDPHFEEPRALMAADWLIRVHTVGWLRLADAQQAADMLSCLPQIVDLGQVAAIMEPVEAARQSAVAARDGAWFAPANIASGPERAAFWGRTSAAPWVQASAAAAQSAAAAARDAARAGALDAARDAIWARSGLRPSATVWNAAVSAANVAAHAGAGLSGPKGLQDTRESLQHSAAGLVNRMIEAR